VHITKRPKYIVEKQQPIIIEGKKDNRNEFEIQQHEQEDENEELNGDTNYKPEFKKEYDPNRKF
jgi:5S rRNA maturation endonuclease (ribonuclease M5)